MVIHDGTAAYMTEYGHIYSSTGLGTFDAVISGGNLLLKITAASSASRTIKVLSTATLV